MVEAGTVAILGAGPAGLSAAHFLYQQEVDCTVFEATNKSGGLASAVSLWGRELDLGPHTFLESSQPKAVAFWKQLGGQHIQNLPLNRGMVLRKRVITFPPKPWGLLNALGPIKCSLAGASHLASKLKSPPLPVSAEDFFISQFRAVFNDLVFDPFCEKYMGKHAKEVDSGFATALSSFAHQTGKTDIQADPSSMKNLLYPEDGTAAQWKRLVYQIENQKPIQLNKKVKGFKLSDSRITAVVFEDGSQVVTNYILSSISIRTMLQMLGNCPPKVKKAAEEIKTRNTVLVYLHLNKTTFPQHYITVFDHSLEVGRISNFDNWQPNRQFQDTVVCLEYWCQSEDKNWLLGEHEMIAKAMHELVLVGLAKKEAFLEGAVVKIPHSHPVLDLSHKNNLQEINDYLNSFTNLKLLGRHATFSWDGQADNLMAGMMVAEQIKTQQW